jgi:HEAT repeat protein
MRLDLILSFALGFFAASLLYLFLYRSRARLIAARDRFTASSKRLVERLNASTDGRYRLDVLALWQSRHLAGSILKFDDVFVAPRFRIEPPLIEPKKEIEYDLTTVVPATIDYADLPAAYQAPAHTLRDLARAEHNLVILGRPGTGKSAALTRLALLAAKSDKDDDFFPRPTVPVLIHAGDLDLPAGDKTDPAGLLIDAASARLGAMTAPAFPSYCRAALKDGAVTLFLDGYDDLPLAHQNLVIEWLRKFITNYGDNRIIATGPLTGFAPLLELEFVPVFAGGWSNDHYRALADRWLAAWPSVKQNRKRAADEGVDPAMVAGWLSSGAGGRTPFDVTLRIWTGLAGDAEGLRAPDWVETYINRLMIAPEARYALGRAAAEMLSAERYGLPRARWLELITDGRSQTANASGMDAEDLLDELAGKGRLLARRAGGRFSSAQLLVAGYLAATQLAASPEMMIEALHARSTEPLWSAALNYYASLGDISTIAAQRLAPPPDAAHTDLFTLASWLSDAPSTASWRTEVFRRLAQFFTNPKLPKHLRARAACALLASRDESVAKFFKQNLAAPDPLARQYSAAVLGVMGDAAVVPDIRKLLRDKEFSVQQAATLALARLGDKAAMDGLAAALIEGKEMLRISVCEALALHPAEGHPMLKEGIKDKDTVIRRGAVSGLQRVGNQPWVLQLLEEAYEHDHQWIVRSAAEVAARELREPPDHLPKPVPSPETLGWLVEFAASKGRGVPAGPAGKTALLQALQEGDDDELKAAAADHLGRLLAVDAVPALSAAARDASPGTRDAAYQALTYIALATGQRLTF